MSPTRYCRERFDIYAFVIRIFAAQIYIERRGALFVARPLLFHSCVRPGRHGPRGRGDNWILNDENNGSSPPPGIRPRDICVCPLCVNDPSPQNGLRFFFFFSRIFISNAKRAAGRDRFGGFRLASLGRPGSARPVVGSIVVHDNRFGKRSHRSRVGTNVS